MLIEPERTTGALRVDEEGFAALRAGIHPDAVLAVTAGRLGTALAVVEDPLVTVTLTVVGARTRLEHRAYVDRDTVLLVIAVDAETYQLMTLTPAFLTAALVRLTRMRPRRPDDTGPDFGWELEAHWSGGSRRLVASDGPGGLRLTGSPEEPPRPASNTEAYRILSTLLPTDAELAVR